MNDLIQGGRNAPRQSELGTGGRLSGGLTVVEVLVALAILSIVSAALVASFSLITSLNQSASSDVDYTRMVRSMTDTIREDWSSSVAAWNAGDVGVGTGSDSLAGFVDTKSAGACEGGVSNQLIDDSDPDNPFVLVRKVVITCEQQGALEAQVFEVEYGAP